MSAYKAIFVEKTELVKYKIYKHKNTADEIIKNYFIIIINMWLKTCDFSEILFRWNLTKQFSK